MRHADNAAPGIAQTLRIAPLLRVGHGIAHIGEILVAIGTNQLTERLAVEDKALLLREGKRADSDTRHTAIEGLAALALLDARLHAVEVGIVGRPEVRILHQDGVLDRANSSGRERQALLALTDHLTLGRLERSLNHHRLRLGLLILHLRAHIDRSLLLGDIFEVDKETASGYTVSLHGIRQAHLRAADKPHIAVDTAMVGEVERILRLARGIHLVVRIVGHHRNDTLLARLHTGIRERELNRQVAAQVLLDELAVYIEGLLTHYGLEV